MLSALFVKTVIVSGRHAGYFFENLAEVIGIIKAQLSGDLINQILSGINQLLGVLDFHLGNIIRDGQIHIPAEGGAQVAGTDPQVIGNVRQGQLLGIMFVDIPFCQINKLVGTVFFSLHQKAAHFLAEAVQPQENIVKTAQLSQLFRNITDIGEVLCVRAFLLEQIVKVAVDIDAGADSLGFSGLILTEQGRKLIKNLLKLAAFVVKHSIGHGFFQEVDIEFPIAGAMALSCLRPVEGDGAIRLVIAVVKGLFRLQKGLCKLRELVPFFC